MSASGNPLLAPSGVVNRNGSKLIAASFRPDGSVRKERKVRPGYTPPEDIGRFKVPSVGEQGKGEVVIPGRGKEIGGSGLVSGEVEDDMEVSKTAKKNEKRRMKRMQEREHKLDDLINGGTLDLDNARSDNTEIHLDTVQLCIDKIHLGSEVSVDRKLSSAALDIEKKLKATRKKLRQIELLEMKVAQGEDLEKTQREKISRKGEVEREVAELSQQFERLL